MNYLKFLLSLLLLAPSLAGILDAETWRPGFYAFQNGMDFGSYENEAEILKELGYQGATSVKGGEKRLSERIDIYDQCGLRIPSLYMHLKEKAIPAETLKPLGQNGAESCPDSPETIVLENAALQLMIERRGGHFVSAQLTDSPVNPLSWQATQDTMPEQAHKDAVYKGHFLCMGRIGMPSPGELAKGVPMRGAQTGRLWTIIEEGQQFVEMEGEAPLDGLKVRRHLELGTESPVYFVREHFKNTGALGRLSNVLQHVTIGPPFLSEETLINSNAAQGFSHAFQYPDPYRNTYHFPQAHLGEAGLEPFDLRLSSEPINYLSRHIFSATDTYGWVTAYDPVSGLVFGYVWETEAYPWINFWQHWQDGRPVAKGLEFGTAGVEKPYQQLLERDTTFHGVRSWEYLDAGEAVEKSYLAFLFDIGPDRENPFLLIEKDQIRLNGQIEIDNPFVSDQ